MTQYITRTTELTVTQEGVEFSERSAMLVRIGRSGSIEYVTASHGQQTLAIRVQEWPALRAAIDQMITQCRQA